MNYVQKQNGSILREYLTSVVVRTSSTHRLGGFEGDGAKLVERKHFFGYEICMMCSAHNLSAVFL